MMPMAKGPKLAPGGWKALRVVLLSESALVRRFEHVNGSPIPLQ